MINRNKYLLDLEPFVNKPLVKILTGIRRSGKSTVLHLLKKKLINEGVSENQIIEVNFESFQYASYLTASSFYNYIQSKCTSINKYYLLLDEIQEVNQWEKAINSFMVDFNVDIYITGSNSNLLSSELATFLTGRYVEIPLYTLSFKEYLQFKEVYNSDNLSNENLFINYLRKGGFPMIHTANYSEETVYKIIYDIYSSVILRDTIQRHKIRDIELLERVIKYAFNNIGNTFSGKNIADYFKSQQRKIDVNTVYNYLNALVGSFILYRVPRFDIKGKEILKTQEKFFVSDISLVYATMGYKDSQISGILENLVFLELKRRDYKVFIGKLDTNEIDFVAEKMGQKLYVQVAYKLENEATIKREFGNLLAINDQYPKFVVTLDDFWKENVQGIKHFKINDFLLSNEF